MDPITIIAMTSAAIAFIKDVIPQINEWRQSDDISDEQQQKLQAELISLRDKLSGDEFKNKGWTDRSGR